MSFFKTPERFELPLGDRLFYSVIISILCLIIAGCFGYVFHGPWRNYFDISASLSIPKLLVLALAGSALGASVGLYYLLRRILERIRQKKQLIGPNDRTASLIEKILLLNPDYIGCSVTVRLKDNTEFAGAHWAKTLDATFLVGSFEMKQEDLSSELNAKIRGHLANKQIIQDGTHILKIVQAIGDPNNKLVTQSSPIEQLKEDERIETGKDYLKWANDEVSSITGDFKKKLPLLILA